MDGAGLDCFSMSFAGMMMPGSRVWEKSPGHLLT